MTNCVPLPSVPLRDRCPRCGQPIGTVYAFADGEPVCIPCGQATARASGVKIGGAIDGAELFGGGR